MPARAELGIDLQGILRRSLAVLSHRLGSPRLQDLDMGGPLLFAAILGSVHLLVGILQLMDAACSQVHTMLHVTPVHEPCLNLQP